MKIATRLAALGVVCSLLAAGCGSSPTSGADGNDHQNAAAAKQVYDDFNSMSGSARMDKLVSAAEKEGTLSLYTTLTPESAVAVEKAFESAYQIKVDTYRASSEDIIARVRSEQQAGYAKGNDVLELNGFELTALDSEGFLAGFKGPERTRVIDEGQRDGWTADRMNRFVVSRNTKVIRDADWPKRLEDFADSRYKGAVSLEASEVDWFMTLHDYYRDRGMSEAEFRTMFGKIAGNAKVVDGHAPQIEQLAAGQFGAALSTYDYQAAEVAERGASVSSEPLVEPVVQRANGVALMKSAPHPAAAYLFYVWMLTDGQKVLRDAGLTSSLKADAEDGIDPGVTVLTVDVDKLLKDNKQYSEMYDEALH